AGVPQRVGYATEGRQWMLTNGVTAGSKSVHQMQYYLDLVKVISATVESPSIEIEATAHERNTARRLLAREGIPLEAPFLVLSPGAAYGTAKRWHEDRFAHVADNLARALGFYGAGSRTERERSIAACI